MTGIENGGDGRRIKSVLRASNMIDIIQGNQGATLGHIEESVDLSRGTIHTYLKTLQECGFLRREGDVYRLGYEFLTAGEHVTHQTDLYWAGWEEVNSLAERTGEYAHLAIEERGRQVVIHESIDENAVATKYHLQMRESRQELYNSATGKAILAHLPEDRLDPLLESTDFEAETKNTITGVEELRAELQTVRERGYAINNEERIKGVRSVGAPILNEGNPQGAVSLTALTSRLEGGEFAEEVPNLVKETANLIEVNLNMELSDRSPDGVY